MKGRYMETQRIYALQENGQITLPRTWRERYGLKKGDVLTFEETPDGALKVVPRVAVGLAALNQLTEALQEKGISLSDLMKSGETIRQDLYTEKYGREGEDA
jgi:AbrB family looped-hinge helix DNA binding protein